MNTPEEARWVSRQTFDELWQTYQNALTELNKSRDDLKQADLIIQRLAAESLRLGNLARDYSQKNDELRQHLKSIQTHQEGDN